MEDFNVREKKIQMIERTIIVKFVKDELLSCWNGDLPLPVLLIDPDKEVDLSKVTNRCIDMSMWLKKPIEDFLQNVIKPFTEKPYPGLALDNVDTIEVNDDYYNLLRAIVKRDFYNSKVMDINFADHDWIVLRCSQKPKFTSDTAPYFIDSKSDMWYEFLHSSTQVVENYLTQPAITRPLMLIFGGESGESNSRLDGCKKWLQEMYNSVCRIGHPLEGHVHFIDKEGNTQKVADHPELLETAILPATVKADTDVMIIHRFVDQFNLEALKYAKGVVSEHNLPVIYLANAYEHEKNLSIDLSDFIVHHID